MQLPLSSHPLPMGSLAFAKAYIITMRPYLLFVSGITGIAGASFATEATAAIALPIAIASFFSYGFGQALTDCFQIDTDRVSAPYRPLTQGLIGRGQVLLISTIGLASCMVPFALRQPANLAFGLIAGCGLATYTPFKRRWWGGPWYNAWIVCVLFLMAYAGGTGVPSHRPSFACWAGLSAVFFGYANFVLSGYFKDIHADAQSQYRTLPVVFGRRVASFVSDFLALGFIVSLSASFTLASGTSPAQFAFGEIFLAASGITAVTAQLLLHSVRKDVQSHLPIGLVVHSYILGMAGLSCIQHPSWAAPLVAFYSFFIIALRARPSRSQI
jgi:geranylgeranylglycerol-phosphate geranylgeranyltransferase